MEFLHTPISDLWLVRPHRFIDKRGYFMETYRQESLNPVIGPVTFIQDNESKSVKGVLRGLHMQTGAHAQAKLIRVTQGAVFDVAVDLRRDSPTFGKWFGAEINEENGLMMFIPRGFAHGFVVMSDEAKFNYKVDNYYAPQSELTIKYDDPDIDIQWPNIEQQFITSEKDIVKSISFKEFLNQLF